MSEQSGCNRRRFLRALGAAAAASALSGCFGRWRKDRRSVRGFFKHKREAEEEEQERLQREEKARRKEAEAAAKQAQTTAVAQQKERQLRAQPIVARKDHVRGIFGFDPSLEVFKGKNVEEIAKQLHEWGVNAVWADRKTLARRALVEALHAWQIQVFTTVAMFVGWHDRNRPIRADGTPFQLYVPGHWYQGSCPNQPDDITRKLAEIKDSATHFDIDGVWLDAIRYPTFWETPKPNAEMTCFCPVCLDKFQDWTGVGFPEQVRSVQDTADWILKNREKEWTRFRMECITDVTKQCAEVLRAAKPNAKLGIFCVPWRRKETRGGEMNAIERIVAQDYPSLAKHADVFSPMVYHRMCGETVEWIGEVTDWVAQETHKPVWPVIQAHGEPRCEWNPYRLPDAEFASALRTARDGASSGAVIYALEYLVKDNKLETMAKDFLAT